MKFSDWLESKLKTLNKFSFKENENDTEEEDEEEIDEEEIYRLIDEMREFVLDNDIFLPNGWKAVDVASPSGYFDHGYGDDPFREEAEKIGISKDDLIQEFYSWDNLNSEKFIFNKFQKHLGRKLSQEIYYKIFKRNTIIEFDIKRYKKKEKEYEEHQKKLAELQEKQSKVLERLAKLFKSHSYKTLNLDSKSFYLNYDIEISSSSYSFYITTENGYKLKVSDHAHLTKNRDKDVPDQIFIYCPKEYKDFFDLEMERVEETYRSRGYYDMPDIEIFYSEKDILKAIINYIKEN